MKKEEQARVEKRKAGAFLTMIGFSTAIFLVIVIAMVFQSIKFKNYKDITRKGLTIAGSDVFNLQEGDYYIYIYSSNKANGKIDLEKQEALEPYIVNYFTFVKQNKRKGNICEIRLMDVEEAKNARCVSDHTTYSTASWTNFYVDEANLPMLMYLVVEKGSNQYNYTYDMYITESDIKSKLANSISATIGVAYFPKKKEYAIY